MKNLFLIAILLGFTYSCSKYSEDIKESLVLVGKNKPELVKVLDHYSQNPADSLKYRAACFLISNLKWHNSRQIILPNKIWDEFLFEDSLSKIKIASPKDPVVDHYFYTFKTGEKKNRLKRYLQETTFTDTTQTDIKTLSSEFLINTIDGAFEVRNLPWNKNLSFDEFCEFILPYRLTSEPVFDIRQTLRRQFQNLANIDSIVNDPIKATSAINQYINYFNWDWDDLNSDLPDLGFYNIFFWNINKLTCAHHLAIHKEYKVAALGVDFQAYRAAKIGYFIK